MADKDLKISVAMATYNGEAYVEQQIESILRQTRLPDELVISDDCSSDRTIELIKRTTAGCPFPVRIFPSSRNIGMNGNFEIAIREANGDIIIPSDFDDYWLPERVNETVSAFAESRDVGLFYCNAELTDRDLRPTGTTIFDSRPRLRAITEVSGAEALGCAVLVQGMTIAFHRSLKPFVLPFSDQSAWDRWLSVIALAVGQVRAIDRCLVYWRRHGRNWGAVESEGDLKQHWTRAADKEVYACRVSRWDAIHRRLTEIKANGARLPSGKRLDEFVEASWRCLSFARQRENRKGRPRIARVFGAVSSLARGDYHRYADGVRSCVLDVAAR